ncbi:hypothetical protein D3C77_659100 [compost metagenome]
MLGRTGHALHLIHRQAPKRVDALTLQRGNHAIGSAHLGAVGGGVQGAVQAVVRIDSVITTEVTNCIDALLGCLDQTYRLLHPEQPFQGEILGRP